MSFAITGEQNIREFRLRAMFRMLAFEVKHPGMRVTRVPVAPAIRQSTGLKARSKALLLRDYGEWLINKGIMTTAEVAA